MKKKKIGAIIATLVLSLGLISCMPRGAEMPDGDVKISNQQITGVVDLLLNSADYGKDNSTVLSMLLPEGAAYNITVMREQYVDGNLVDTTEIQKYETAVLEKNDLEHVIFNIGKASGEDSIQSIYSIGEVDKANTEDQKNPNYKITKVKSEAINYDSKTEIATFGSDLSKDIPAIALVKFKEGDSEKKSITLESYQNEVSNYSEVNVIKIKVDKK